jgi:hypothetical protein
MSALAGASDRVSGCISPKTFSPILINVCKHWSHSTHRHVTGEALRKTSAYRVPELGHCTEFKYSTAMYLDGQTPHVLGVSLQQRIKRM